MRRAFQVQQFLEESARRVPHKVALVQQGRRATYGEVDERADRIAGALIASGAEPGERVVVYMESSIDAVAAYFGILKAGCVVIMASPGLRTERLAYIVKNSGAGALITQSSRRAIALSLDCPSLNAVFTCDAAAPEEGPVMIAGRRAPRGTGDRSQPGIDADLAMIIYTSGTTASPKGVMLSHLNILSAAHSIVSYLEQGEDDVVINTMPLSFDYGLYQVLMAFLVGGTVVLEPSWTYPYQVLDVMRRERVTGFPGVPSTFALFLAMRDIGRVELPPLRFITNTAAALPVPHIRALRELFPRARLFSMYGLTECKRVSYLPPEQLDQRPTSIGKGMPNVQVRVVDGEGNEVPPGVAGELVVRGSNVMLGYWGLPEETARFLKAGRYPGERDLYTGDLFTRDREGYLYFVARKDDIIKCGGEKVSPREVEQVLYALPGVAEAAVVGVPDEILGHAIKAVIVKDAAAVLDAAGVLQHCAQLLEPTKVPKYVEFAAALPKTENGKIGRKDLAVTAGPAS